MSSRHEHPHNDVALDEVEDLVDLGVENRAARKRYEAMNITDLAEIIEGLREATNEEDRAQYLALREIYEARKKPTA